MGFSGGGLLGIAFALLLAALPWRGAQAHAVLLESSPAKDAVLAEAPARIVLRFNEPIRPIALRILVTEDQRAVEPVGVEVVDAELRAPLPEALPDGTYLVSYRVASADDHPIVGSFVFTVGAPSTRASPPLAEVGQHDDFWLVAGVAARAFRYGTLLLASGLALFLALLPVPSDLRPPLRRGLAWLTVLGLAACLVMLGATGGALYGGPAGALLSLEPWRIALASPVAASVALAVPGLGILVLAARRALRHEWLVLLAGALPVAASFAVSGHAATAGPGWITLPTLMLHALCAAYWVGALAPLLVALRRLPRDQALLLLRAFSAGAIIAVAGLLLAGVVLSALQLRTPSALIATDYGRLLLLKLAVVALLLGLGAINRLVLTPALERRADAVVGLRRTIGADLALAAGVVVLTAGLGTVPPPRVLAEGAAAHAHADHGARDYTVHLTAPGHNLVL
ncbi:MAG: copper resistance CopC/CopD family protein, partial [Geminicoccaceae bacterium]